MSAAAKKRGKAPARPVTRRGKAPARPVTQRGKAPARPIKRRPTPAAPSTAAAPPPAWIHPSALVEDAVTLGPGTRVWDNVHIRHGARIGASCIVGEKSYIAYDVVIGDRVKINAFVYICAGVTLETGVMVSAATVFTNDRFPRATTPELDRLRPSEPDEHTLLTRVREGATIGAGAVIGNDLEIGRFAMVGMGSVVTRSVPDFHLAIGSPARSVGCLCRCGEPILRFSANRPPALAEMTCPRCARRYRLSDGAVEEAV